MKLLSSKRYKIVSYSSAISPAFRQKLLLQGLRPGSEFVVKAVAPFGGPVKIENDYASLALRRDDLSLIQLDCLN
ncbi:FeoA domain-containing protein [Kalamiella sp. sgz302252]|uniref:FeoA domain-containing protein n=1 Tax=Pantoea sp. sgz302252 TaxID=3341827 RepID=UPI0036D3B6C7